jgi:predicted ATPase
MAQLSRLFPVLERIPAVADAAARGAAAPTDVRAAADALKALLRSIAARAPLAVVIDDVQWGDRPSAALLREVLSPPDAPGLLLVAVCRNDAPGGSPFLEELLANPPGEQRAVELGASRKS